MNEANIIKLAEVIAETHHRADTFDMSVWLDVDNPDRFQPIKNLNDLDEITDMASDCGTRGCIAGWAAVLFGDRRIWQNRIRGAGAETLPTYAELAATLLDITPAQAELLFTPTEGSDYYRQIPYGYQVTAHDAAETLYRLALTGEVQWRIERCLCCGDAANTYDCRCTVGECSCCIDAPGDDTYCAEGPDCCCRARSE